MRITQEDNMTIIWFAKDKKTTELKQFVSKNGELVTIGIYNDKIANIFIDVNKK